MRYLTRKPATGKTIPLTAPPTPLSQRMACWFAVVNVPLAGVAALPTLVLLLLVFSAPHLALPMLLLPVTGYWLLYAYVRHGKYGEAGLAWWKVWPPTIVLNGVMLVFMLANLVWFSPDGSVPVFGTVAVSVAFAGAIVLASVATVSCLHRTR